MGIPGFAHRMRKYGCSRVIGRGLAKERTIAVIDGPSLAHSIFNSSDHTQSAGPEFAPHYDYADLGRSAVSWLDTLESHGFEVEGIYFDGALPSYKKQTRIDRLQTYINKLVNFKRIDDEVDRAAQRYGYRTIDNRDVLRLEVASKELPPPPFLVFAVVEALLASHYAARCWVVNGEADGFCAAAALKASHGRFDIAVSIFTNDSDLIVYHSGPQTRIVMMNQMKFSNSKTGKVLEGFEYWPANIASMAGHNSTDLIRPAFEMLHTTISFPQAIARSASDVTGKEYHAFVAIYDTTEPSVELEKLENNRRCGKYVLQADSRTSELICQAITPSQSQRSDVGAQTISKRNGYTPIALDLFLPVLFEDPTKATAWRIGVVFRAAASSLVTMQAGLDCSILEYRRAGLRIAGSNIETRSATALGECLVDLSKCLRDNSDSLAGLERIPRWRYQIMRLTLEDMVQQNTKLPYENQIVDVLADQPTTDWPTIHLSARFQAEYYCLRMLKQVIAWVRGVSPTLEHSITGFDLLEMNVQSLPGIADFFGSDATSVGLGRWQPFVQDLLQRMRPWSPLHEQPDQTQNKHTNRKSKTTQVKPRRRCEGHGTPSSNPFAALAEQVPSV